MRFKTKVIEVEAIQVKDLRARVLGREPLPGVWARLWGERIHWATPAEERTVAFSDGECLRWCNDPDWIVYQDDQLRRFSNAIFLTRYEPA